MMSSPFETYHPSLPRLPSSSCVVIASLVTIILTSCIPSSWAQNEVHSVDVFPRENAKAHRTSAYEIVHNPNNPSLVIRRGDPFYLALQMRRPYDPIRDKIRLEFMYGPRPLLGKKTLIYLPVTTNREFTKDSSRWDARTHRVDGNVITVQVHVPANVAVGVWRLRVSTKQQGSRAIRSFDVRERMYILFNAWCKGRCLLNETNYTFLMQLFLLFCILNLLLLLNNIFLILMTCSHYFLST